MERAPKIVGALLDEALMAASHKRASFQVPENLRSLYTPDEWTALVNETTRLYRETWLIPVIEDAKRYLDGEVSAARLERDHPMLSTR